MNFDKNYSDEEFFKLKHEQEEKLRYAIWEHIEFLNKAVGFKNPKTLRKELDDDITVFAFEYKRTEGYFEYKRFIQGNR